MSKYRPINGWTKEKMIERIQQKNLGRRSINKGSTICLYRAENGNACAVGSFIPDDLYRKEMDEVGGAYSLVKYFPELVPHMPLDGEPLLAMQSVHDATEDGDDPRPRLVNWINENVVSI